MKSATTLIYDGSFNGFLTAVFVAFEEKLHVVDIQKIGQCPNGLFSGTQPVFTQIDKAKRVWHGLRNKNHNAMANIYFAYLSGAEGVEPMLYGHIQKLMSLSKGESLEPSQDNLYLEQLARKVGREKYRMEAHVQFQISKDHIQYALIDPEYDVLPLISKHFRARHHQTCWLIHDLRRQYGIFYNLDHVEMVTLALGKYAPAKTYKKDAGAQGTNRLQELINRSGIQGLVKPKLHPRTLVAPPRDHGNIVKEAV